MQKTWTWINNLIMLILSWIFYVLFILYLGITPEYNSSGTMGIAFSSPRIYLLLFFVTSVNYLIDIATYSYFMLFMKSLVQALRILVKEKGVIDDESLITDEIAVYYGKYKFALNDGMTEMKEKKKKKKGNLKDLDKIDGLNSVEMISDSSHKGDYDLVKAKDNLQK